MKKLTILFLILTLLFSLTACNGQETSEKKDNTTPTSTPLKSGIPVKTFNDNDNAVFTNTLLENWVRKKLEKEDGSPILIKELDKITEIYFVAGATVDSRDQVPDKYLFGGYYGVEGKLGCDFYDLADFSQFRRLKSLAVMGQQVTDISPLAGLPLKYLNLTMNHVSDLSPLSSMKTLEELILMSNPVEDLSPLSSHHRMTHLDVSHTLLTDLKPVLGLRGLKDLDIAYDNISDLSGLGKIELNSLEMECVPVKDWSFLKGNSLGFLKISSLTTEQAECISSSDIKGLGLFYADDKPNDIFSDSIEFVTIWDCSFENLDFLKGCPNINDLECSRTPMINISALASMKKLRSISLLGTNTYDVSVLESIDSLSNVKLTSLAEKSYLSFKSNVSWEAELDDGYYERCRPVPYTLSKGVEPALSSIQMADERYISMKDVGTYNDMIITNEMINKESTLPDASNQELPYWKGTYSMERAFVNLKEQIPYFREESVKFINDMGMNYLRIIYSFSYLGNPSDPYQINEAELERIDELVSWGIQHDVHIQITMFGLPNKYGSGTDSEDVGSSGGNEYFRSKEQQKLVKDYWSMLAKRYAAISNRYLSFDLYAEPNYWNAGEGNFARITTELVAAIWEAEGNKSDAEKRITVVEVQSIDKDAERIAEFGCALTCHTSGVHWFMSDGDAMSGFYTSYPYIPDAVEWPVMYMQSTLYSEGSNVLTIKSETEFPAGTEIGVFVQFGFQNVLTIKADGKVALRESKVQPWTKKDNNVYAVTLDKAAKTVEIINDLSDGGVHGWLDLYQITIKIPGLDTLHLVPHTFGTTMPIINEVPVTITIASDGKATSNKVFDKDWYYNTQVLPFVKLAEKHGVGFMLGEVQTVQGKTTSDLASEYLEMMLSNLAEHSIGWSVECMNTLTQSSRMGAQPIQYKDTCWMYDQKLMDVIRNYTK